MSEHNGRLRAARERLSSRRVPGEPMTRESAATVREALPLPDPQRPGRLARKLQDWRREAAYRGVVSRPRCRSGVRPCRARHRGELHVVLPAADYRERKVKPADREAFEDLFERAEKVHVLPFETSDRDAYATANDAVLSDVDALIAVWDGLPPDGRGGTGDTVLLARERGVPVTVVWPEGARRQ